MNAKIRQGFWNAVGAYPFGVLLAALMLMLALSPVISFFGEFAKLFEGIRALAPLSLLVVSASMMALWQRARHHAMSMFAAGIVIVLLALGSFIAHRTLIPLQLAAQIVFLGYVMAIVVRSVFTARNVTGDILSGAVCVYLLTGIIAGLCFILIELFLPGSFRVASWSGSAMDQQNSFINDPGWLLYFSFVTLTTVGYGDVLPDSSVARSASVMVAVIGQILLMVMIARLVGINVVQAADAKSSKAGERADS